MPILLMISLFFYSSTSPLLLSAYPTKDSSMNRNEASYVTQETTTEVANTTGNLMSSVWHKISNIFNTETTSQGENQTKHEKLMPEERIPTGGEREFRMAPVDFSKRGEEEDAWQRDMDGEGNLFPIHHQQLQRRSSIEEIDSENRNPSAEEVRCKKSTKCHNVIKARVKRSSHLVTNQPIPIFVEEFDQGETQNGQIQRWKDIKKYTDWKTEVIVEGSDPVENLDNENYIEESKNVDFPFHSITIQPIIVEDSLSQAITTVTQKELPPLKIIEY